MFLLESFIVSEKQQKNIEKMTLREGLEVPAKVWKVPKKSHRPVFSVMS